jgi:uncharacterized membrane protein
MCLAASLAFLAVIVLIAFGAFWVRRPEVSRYRWATLGLIAASAALVVAAATWMARACS